MVRIQWDGHASCFGDIEFGFQPIAQGRPPPSLRRSVAWARIAVVMIISTTLRRWIARLACRYSAVKRDVWLDNRFFFIVIHLRFVDNFLFDYTEDCII